MNFIQLILIIYIMYRIWVIETWKPITDRDEIIKKIIYFNNTQKWLFIHFAITLIWIFSLII